MLGGMCSGSTSTILIDEERAGNQVIIRMKTDKSGRFYHFHSFMQYIHMNRHTHIHTIIRTNHKSYISMIASLYSQSKISTIIMII